MATAIEGPLEVETVQEPATPGSQPAFQPEPQLDEAAVRAAVMQAEAQGKNPLDLDVKDLAQGSKPEETKAPEVPEKFKTPTGEVDVEKIKTSTRQLDEAIQQKEQKVQKTVEDYLAEYRAKENKFRNIPNPEKMAQILPSVPPPPVPDTPQKMSDQQLWEAINRDFQTNPALAAMQLIDIAVQKRMEPVEKERQDNLIRRNIQVLAEKDARVMQPEIFAAINAKLESDPDLWKLKNPHKAAWLEVKEELRLGEPKEVQAQPSRPPSPILGGGTPPPAPSSSGGPITQDTIASAISQVNPKDQSQMASLEKAAKAYFDRVYRR